ncbi:MAG: aldehyde dehydrogenase family protein [Hyphomicrobium sp.]
MSEPINWTAERALLRMPGWRGRGRLICVNPATEEPFAEVGSAEPDDVDRAVEEADRAYRSGVWSKLEPGDRAAVLHRFAKLIEADCKKLALLDTLSAGKPINATYGSEIPDVAKTVRFYAEAIDKIEGQVTATGPNALHYVLRQPLGVVGAITPWNYPALMASWKFAAALAAGNSVVLKPSELAPLSSLWLAELFLQAGGPQGVFSVVPGLGDVAGKALALHKKVAKIAFTGSTRTGGLIMGYAGQSNLKQVALECGGKSPQIVIGHGNDLQRAAEVIATSVFDNAGQVCNAGSRLIVDDANHDELLERIVGLLGDWAAGDPMLEETRVGPLISADAKARVLRYANEALEEGASCAGAAPVTMTRGYYFPSTVFSGVEVGHKLAQEEVFGPVLAVMRVKDAAEAVAVANANDYGLAAGIWTCDVAMAHALARDVEAGVVWVNCYDDTNMSQPFGGTKLSGHGRDKGLAALLSYTQTKSVWVDLSKALA